jgi:hypothetical protein
MRRRHRDILDPNDPYWPRVRRLHIYLWAHGTIAASNGYVVLWSCLWMAFSIFGRLFSLAWRGALLLGALFLIDRAAPGTVSCVFRETIGYEVSLFMLSSCTMFAVSHPRLISLAAILVMILLLVYPIRTFLAKIFEITFMIVNIIALGYPLKLVAYLASHEPTVAGKWFDKNYVFGPISTAMTDIFPPEYKNNLDHLWDVYRRSQSPVYEQDLEDVLEDLEAKYLGGNVIRDHPAQPLG